MIDLLVTLGRTLGFSLAAGVNLYATVAMLGLAARFDWVELPPQFALFDNDVVIGVALGMYVVEFLADKIPVVDSLWDALHTLIRPIGGAVVAATTFGDATPTVRGLIALLGGAVAAGSHATKAGGRVLANTSPEPFSNWLLSFLEDVLVVGLAFLALRYPLAALASVGLAILVMGVLLIVLFRSIRRRLAPPAVSYTDRAVAADSAGDHGHAGRIARVGRPGGADGAGDG